MQNLMQKRSGLLLVILFLSLIVLSSCSSGDKVSPDTVASTDTNLNDDVKHMLANQDKLNLIVAKGGVKECGTLDMPQYRLSCESNILANRAKSKEDTAVCAIASTSQVKARCETLVSHKKF